MQKMQTKGRMFEITDQIPKNDKINILRWPSEYRNALEETHNPYVLCFPLGLL